MWVISIIVVPLLTILFGILLDKLFLQDRDEKFIYIDCLKHLIELENKKKRYIESGNNRGKANCTRYQIYWITRWGNKGWITSKKLIRVDEFISLLGKENPEEALKKSGWEIGGMPVDLFEKSK